MGLYQASFKVKHECPYRTVSERYPDLNPPEQLWTHVKYGQMANYVPKTIGQLHRRAEQLIAEKQSQQETLLNYIRTAKLAI
jgi:hypothetical protein